MQLKATNILIERSRVGIARATQQRGIVSEMLRSLRPGFNLKVRHSLYEFYCQEFQKYFRAVFSRTSIPFFIP